MKILLDECIPADLRHYLPEHEVHTVGWAGFKGYRNGQLISMAEAAGYSVLLTIDQGMPYQQRLDDRNIAIVAVRAHTNRLMDILPQIEAIRVAVAGAVPGSVSFV